MSLTNIILTYSVGLLAVLSFVLGIYSIIVNSKSFTVKLWFLLSMAIAFWSANLFMLMNFSKTENNGIFYSKLLHVGASFIPIFFYHFVLSFSFQLGDKRKQIFLKFGYALATIFAALSLTPLIGSGVSPRSGFPFWVDAGILYPFLLIYFWTYVFATLYFLYQAYTNTGGVMKKKTLYLLIASIIAFGFGGTNFLPQTIGIYPFGGFIIWIYPILVTYGIFLDNK